MGYRFEITTERKIKGTFQGTKPPEASVLLEIVRHDHESAVAYVLEHKVRRNAVINGNTYSVFDAVAVSEAVALAKSLSTDESPQFINGLLGRLQQLKPSLLA